MCIAFVIKGNKGEMLGVREATDSSDSGAPLLGQDVGQDDGVEIEVEDEGISGCGYGTIAPITKPIE